MGDGRGGETLGRPGKTAGSGTTRPPAPSAGARSGAVRTIASTRPTSSSSKASALGKQHGDELADGRPQQLGLVDAAIRAAQRIGRPLGRIVGIVGGPAAGRLAGLDFNQVAMVVEVDEAAIAPHLERLADVARQHGVQAPTELDVVIGMDRAACPRRAIEGLRGQWQRHALPLGLGRRVGGPGGVVPCPRVPASSRHQTVARACMSARSRGSAPAEEVLADVGDPSLRFRFPGGVARDSGIDDEAAVLRVLEEATRDRGRIAIGAARTGGNHSRAGRRTPGGRKLWRDCWGNTSENQAIARRKECAGKFTLESSSRLWIDHDKALK